jgi:hypothetical protein
LSGILLSPGQGSLKGHRSAFLFSFDWLRSQSKSEGFQILPGDAMKPDSCDGIVGPPTAIRFTKTRSTKKKPGTCVPGNFGGLNKTEAHHAIMAAVFASFPFGGPDDLQRAGASAQNAD